MKRTPLRAAVLLLSTLAGGCALHSTARHWHERVGPEGEPVYYTATTKIGVNFLVVVPLFGDTGIAGMVDDLTENVASGGGDHIRIVQGSAENYWYGFPPFTWVLTPVVATLTAEYRPSPEELAADRAEAAEED